MKKMLLRGLYNLQPTRELLFNDWVSYRRQGADLVFCGCPLTQMIVNDGFTTWQNLCELYENDDCDNTLVEEAVISILKENYDHEGYDLYEFWMAWDDYECGASLESLKQCVIQVAEYHDHEFFANTNLPVYKE